jgi:Tn3 transposase DDE domain
MQLALAIESGMLAPSAVLARINSYSTRNRLALALQELGKAVRTTYLLEWIIDRDMRRRCTSVRRRWRDITTSPSICHSAGTAGFAQTIRPIKEKAVVYNEVIANAVTLQSVVDQTRALHALKSEGATIRSADLAFLSPYPTRNLKRFGDYQTDLIPEPIPDTMEVQITHP